MRAKKIIPILAAVVFFLTASSAMASYVIDFGVVAGHGTDWEPLVMVGPVDL